MTSPDDPVLVRRAQIARLVSTGQRVGYGLFGLALALFVIGFASGFDYGIPAAITFCLVAGSIILAPAIVFGYGVRAAERHDQGLPDGH